MVHVLYVHLCNLHVYMYTNLCVCGGGGGGMCVCVYGGGGEQLKVRPYHSPLGTTIQGEGGE